MRVLGLAVLVSTSFAGASAAPLEPLPLTWTMDLARAMQALAKLSPREDTRRGYFPGPHGPEHTSEPEIIYSPRPGWTGDALWRWSDADKAFRLAEVTITATVAPRAAAAELTALEQRNGAPATRTAKQRTWTSGGAALVASTSDEDPKTKQVSLYIAYRRIR